jgi:DNA invertase Pin-like site-specific DNA recombinase
MERRAVIYCRISQDREGAGLGVDRQEQDCRALAGRLGWAVAAVHVDNDVSASNGKARPGYAALLSDLRAGRADAVLCWHTDRLHRRPVELEEYIAVCEQGEVPTATVKAGPLDLATPSGRMVARQLGAVARFEVEHNAERSQRARLQAATDGRWAGGTRPYGYAADGTTVVEAEAAVIRQAAGAVLAGRTLRGIARELNGRGVRTSTGGAWRPSAVRRVLVPARNAALAAYRGEVVGPATWPAVLDEDTWRAVVAVLTDPARRTNPGGGQPRWLLSGLAACGVCGAKVRASASAGRPAYMCSSGKHVARDARHADQFVAAVIVERLRRPDAVDLLAAEPADTTALHLQADSYRQRLKGLADAYADDAIDAAQLRSGSDRLRARLALVEEEIAAAARGQVLPELAGDDPADPAAVWEGLDFDRRRAVVEVLVDVTILPARRGRRPGWRPGEPYFDPASVRVEPKRQA